MKYLNKPVAYLVDKDYDGNGNLNNVNIPDNKPIVVMIQADFCGHCTHAKPAFQEFANNNKDVFCATIQGDGDELGEKELSKKLSSFLPDFRGFPEYAGYKNKKFVKMHAGGRSVQDLREFANSL
jgi:thiol-disulfide isomerase/thioredoxin